MRDLNFAGVRASSRRALTAAVFAGAGLALAPGFAAAADTDKPTASVADEQSRNTTTVSEVEAKGRKERLDSPKYTSKPVDTPQTITVVTSAVIEAQNLLTLRDILSTVPGITFGAGEGGGGYGDSINLRGFGASSDITTDGVRDSAQYSRTDPFNLEQLEVTNGANGAVAGSGSVGGSINLVSKTALARDTTTATLGGGTAEYLRGTLDMNKMIGDGMAVRLNLMGHQNRVPGRDVEQLSRWGVAPTIAFGLGSPTEIALSYLHQKDDNIPEYGLPYYQNAFYDGPLPGVPLSNYYGYSNIDTQESVVDSFTLRIDHRISDKASLRSLTRHQTVDQHLIVDVPQAGAWCLASGVNQVGAACATPGFYTPGGPRGNFRDTQNMTNYHQTDLRLQFSAGGFEHNMTAGFSLVDETYHLENGNIFRNADGSALAASCQPNMSILTPNNTYACTTNRILGGGSTSSTATTSPSGGQDGTRRNEAVYVFDTLKLSDRFELNGGVRYEHNAGENSTTYYTYFGRAPGGGSNLGAVTPGAAGGVLNGVSPIARNEDNLLSYRFGLVFKPTLNSSVYAAYGNSQTPSQSAVNGSCSATGTAQNCNLDPEGARNYEIGAKWDVRNNLSLTAAVFRNERSPYRVADPDPSGPGFQLLDGESRVDGVTLGVSGRIDKHWSVFANYTYLDSVVVKGKADLCYLVPVPVPNNCPTAAADPTGKPLTSTPDHSGSLWITYDFANRVQLGYGLTYQGKALFSNTVAPSAFVYSHPYAVSRVMLNWPINRKAELRINVNNLFDKVYFTRIRNGGWATPGEARSANMTLSYRF